MLAASAPDVGAALAETGVASVEWKLDGARIQVHRDGDEVRVFTRNLNDITDRLPASWPWPGRCRCERSCSTASRSASTRTASRTRSRTR